MTPPIMINCKGPKNLIRILQCRDVDMKTLKAIIVDHACQLDSYISNREAYMLQYKLLLVDGSHWYGQKKMKKSSSQNTGHLGCSDGFNFNKIKASFKTKNNSQNRKQLNAQIKKCADSLQLINYQHSMLFM